MVLFFVPLTSYPLDRLAHMVPPSEVPTLCAFITLPVDGKGGWAVSPLDDTKTLCNPHEFIRDWAKRTPSASSLEGEALFGVYQSVLSDMVDLTVWGKLFQQRSTLSPLAVQFVRYALRQLIQTLMQIQQWQPKRISKQTPQGWMQYTSFDAYMFNAYWVNQCVYWHDVLRGQKSTLRIVPMRLVSPLQESSTFRGVGERSQAPPPPPPELMNNHAMDVTAGMVMREEHVPLNKLDDRQFVLYFPEQAAIVDERRREIVYRLGYLAYDDVMRSLREDREVSLALYAWMLLEVSRSEQAIHVGIPIRQGSAHVFIQTSIAYAQQHKQSCVCFAGRLQKEQRDALIVYWVAGQQCWIYQPWGVVGDMELWKNVLGMTNIVWYAQQLPPDRSGVFYCVWVWERCVRRRITPQTPWQEWLREESPPPAEREKWYRLAEKMFQ